jgi:hypothetical protein
MVLWTVIPFATGPGVCRSDTTGTGDRKQKRNQYDPESLEGHAGPLPPPDVLAPSYNL